MTLGIYPFPLGRYMKVQVVNITPDIRMIDVRVHLDLPVGREEVYAALATEFTSSTHSVDNVLYDPDSHNYLVTVVRHFIKKEG